MSSSIAETVIDLYQTHAAAWVRSRRHDLFERAWLDAFLDLLPASEPQILDLGCGSGRPVAEYLIGKGGRITGVDGAEAMIAQAEAAFPDQTWLVADMRNLPPLPAFDGLIAWHSFFHLSPEAQGTMFETMGRLTRPGAGLLFTSGPARGESLGEFEGQPLYHASLDSDEYSALLTRNGFQKVRHVTSDPACGGATIWLARKELS
ncbi:MAG: class I SAM-dependent methyltransferase [Asticcacaulis sp.]|uniref:class I SAM-dependent DNA methyltransferase n=1 Tax=Asticcacaulis sp. TaxID=1872648 RepID=UPI0039E2AFB4